MHDRESEGYWAAYRRAEDRIKKAEGDRWSPERTLLLRDAAKAMFAGEPKPWYPESGFDVILAKEKERMTEEKHTIDIAPAISELKRLHLALVEKARQNMDESLVSGIHGYTEAKDTVISVVPKDRRREFGWYKFKTWERKSDKLLEIVDKSFHRRQYHEIFIAGEALAGDSEDLVYLLMHQVAHQAAAVPSIRSYHGEWYKHWSQRLWGIPQEAWQRDEVMGWVNIDKTKVPDKTKAFVKFLADSVDLGATDMYREFTPPTKTGRMFLWACDCGRPKVRTGGQPRYTCDTCGTKVKFDLDKNDNAGYDFVKRIPEEYIRRNHVKNDST